MNPPNQDIRPRIQPDGSLWVGLATAACVLFGIALILNVQPIGDGLWFWYATAIRQHQHLYSDLHVNQQPFFFLVGALFQQVFGVGWLASKILALLQLLLFCTGLVQVSRFIPWCGWQRGLLVAAAFAMAITSPYYRFDDYHVTTQCMQLFSLVLLLKLARGVSARVQLPLAACVGALCGLASGNRLNVGAGLALACALALPVLLPQRRLQALAAFGAGFAAALLALIKLTGDSLAIWWLETVTHASRIKGGTGSVFHAMGSFPFRVAHAALQPKGLLLLVGVAAAFFLFACFPAVLRAGARLRTATDWLVLGYLLLLGALIFWQGTKNLANAKLAQFGVLFAIAAGLWVHWFVLRRLLRHQTGGNSLQVLLLVPFWALMAAAMTSGIYLPDYASHVALLLLLVPIALPFPFDRSWQRRGWLLLAALTIVAALPAKTLVPYSWHHYHSEPLFRDRVWYQHPVYGPMLIERPQLAFMQPLCAAVHAGGGETTLLATPYPYANYFCAVPPWHGFVQTWYDTASREQIETLEHQIAQSPPEWVVYQRGLDTLSVHEEAYNGGHPLAQRDLDTQMMGNVVAGRWTVLQRQCLGGSDWMLLRTSPPLAGEHTGQPADAEDRQTVCRASETLAGEGRF